MNLWLLINWSIHISLVLPSDTQPKPFSLQCTINLFLPSLTNKSLVCTSSIFLQPLTQSVTTYYSKDWLSAWLGFTDTPLLWIQSFSLFIRPDIEIIIQIILTHLWCSAKFSSCAPPVHLLQYNTPLSSLIKASSLDHYLYAVDAQLFIFFSPSSFSESTDNFLHVLKQISSWMTPNLSHLRQNS